MNERQKVLASELTSVVNDYIDDFEVFGPYAKIGIQPETLAIRIFKPDQDTGKEKYDLIPAMTLVINANPADGIFEPDPNQIEALASQY